MTNERNCENCVHAKPFGGENDNRCDAWECDYINRKEAIEAYKARRDDPPIEIVRCGECKYCGESLLYPIEMVCKYHLGHTYYTEADRFCYYGERRANGHTD